MSCENAYCPAALVVSVRSSPSPASVTVTPPRPSPSTLTWPTIPAVRRYVPSKLTTFDSPTPTVAAPEVLEKLTSLLSKLEISTEYVPARSPVKEYWPESSVVA